MINSVIKAFYTISKTKNKIVFLFCLLVPLILNHNKILSIEEVSRYRNYIILISILVSIFVIYELIFYKFTPFFNKIISLKLLLRDKQSLKVLSYFYFNNDSTLSLLEEGVTRKLERIGVIIKEHEGQDISIHWGDYPYYTLNIFFKKVLFYKITKDIWKRRKFLDTKTNFENFCISFDNYLKSNIDKSILKDEDKLNFYLFTQIHNHLNNIKEFVPQENIRWELTCSLFFFLLKKGFSYQDTLEIVENSSLKEDATKLNEDLTSIYN